MKPRYWLSLSVAVLTTFGAVLGCNNRKDSPVAPSRVISLNVSVPQTKELQASLLGSASDILLYSATSASETVTGKVGPFSDQSGAGNINLNLGLPSAGTWLLALELESSSDKNPLAVGAAQVEVDSQSGAITLQMGSVSRNCYKTDTWMDPGGSYFSFQNDLLSTGYFGSADINVATTGTAYYILTQAGDLVQYMGNGPLVNYAAAPVTETNICSATSKLAAGAPVSTLQAGDVFCFQLLGGGYAWLQVINPGSPTVGPSFRYRVNTTVPYYAYERTTADTAGSCLTPVNTPTITPTATSTPTITATFTPTTTVTVTTMTGTFNGPTGVGMDYSGNVFVLDTGNNRLQVITTADAVTTLSSGFNAPKGLYLSNNGGSLFLADTGNNKIYYVNSGTGVTTLEAGTGAAGVTDGSTSIAEFDLPVGLASDSSGNIYAADTGNSTIRFISGGSVTTLAGSAGVTGFNNATGPTALFNHPTGIATNSYGLYGTLYVADTNNNMIRALDLSTGTVTTFAGQSTPGAVNAIGTSASFNHPTGLAMDSYGNLYVADSGNNLIREININTANVTTLAGSGAQGSANGNGYVASFNNPYGIAVNSAGTTLVVGDTGNGLVRQVVF
jgi:hypothetical protein